MIFLHSDYHCHMSEPAEKRCPKCSGVFEPGFILDVHRGAYKAAEWVEGVPEKSFWVGLKISERVRCEIRSFRCTKCGYLESYAA